VLLVSQSLAEAARHLGSIAAAAHGPVRALPISVRADTLFSVSVVAPWLRGKRLRRGVVERFGS
jgi:hypothetical protein